MSDASQSSPRIGTVSGYGADSVVRASTSHGYAAGNQSSPRTPAPTPERPSSILCPACHGTVDVKSKHVAVIAGAVRVYCSAECLKQRDALPAEAQTVSITLPPKRRWVWLWLPFVAAAAGATAWFVFLRDGDDLLVPPAPAVSTTHTPADPEPGVVADPQREADAAIMQELARDAWIHPLAGPTRRMPKSHTGAFGAERPGERPPECVSGHCGVDLGYVWGERVYAVHEGVIDFVNRGPNEDAGGVFVRISHRGGTLFSWYFHLAAVPRWIRPGQIVTAGTMIGLVGDTGVKNSGPHLHFALSVRTSKHVRERYLDPEPLIAIWPLWNPNEAGDGGKLSTRDEPGVPMRGDHGGGKKRKQKKSRVEAPEESAPTLVMPEPTEPATGTTN